MYLCIAVECRSLLLDQDLELGHGQDGVLLVVVGPHPQPRHLARQVAVGEGPGPRPLRVGALDTDVEQRELAGQLAAPVAVLQLHTAALRLDLSCFGNKRGELQVGAG